ncbi:M20 family peptidase [Flagellimonas aequoris]|uniref:M20/M25/M40 family metallo-hydrolase n=1 Tax=Flagellimonas aequoris TaxID=2306997 RepID=A0A418N3Y4_9FLAO|nr:M20 family peptidase [Allomuricauda aequoris]RIV68597.1 M20/M25/M40 family metallo-hydrolase [Allomuricauda aequoris]TXK00297.1 M20/M25/M40 family metallo-hydrolase [Allomuricauda aequoris]
MKKFLFVLLSLIIVLAAVLTFNTLSLTSKQVAPDPLQKMEFPANAYQHLSKAVQFETISYSEDAIPDSTAFNGFHQFLQETYPLIHEKLTLEKISDYSLLFKWEGSDTSKKPIILMSHQDVVPVDQPTLSDWEAPPFAGKITDTHIIGRGTLDDKSSLMALMESIETLLKESFTPSQTIYLAFGHDEELGGSNGAQKIAAYLKEKGIHAAMTLDEGGLLAENMVPGFDKTIAMLNLAEKGYASFNLIVETKGGHSSSPPKDNTLGMLAQAIVDLENNQLPYKLVKPIDYQFEYMGAEMPFFKKMAFANPWLFKGPVLKALNAHTTTAPTIVEGGVKDNVIPTVGKATINFRILPGETIASVKEHIEKTVGDKVKVELAGFAVDPSPVSGIDSEAFKTLEKTIRSVFPDVVVVPGLIGGGTDARYFYGVSDDVYRFYPIRISPESFSRFHGIDEKISKENYREMVEFSYQMIKKFN